jgi:hypothetical protein
MKDELTVKALTVLQLDKIKGLLPRDEGGSQMVATGEYELSFDPDGVPKCNVTNVNIEHKNSAILSQLDPRMVFEKIKGILEGIYNNVKKSFFEKKNTKMPESQTQRP